MTASDSAASYTLHGQDLSWLDLMLLDAVPPRYELPGSQHLVATTPTLRVPTEVAQLARKHGELALLDPEGVTLARLVVDDVRSADESWLAGPVTIATGFQHMDQLDLRRPPSEISGSWAPGPVVALWSDVPVPFSLRQATRELARAEAGSVLEVVPVPSGQETSLPAHLGPRLARLAATRDEQDRAVVIPAPALGWDAGELLLRAEIVRAYGATSLALSPAILDSLGEHREAVTGASADLGIELRALAVSPAQATLSRQDLDHLLETNKSIPGWYAEPTVGAEIRRIIRTPREAGFTVLLSGLSGSGKSTVARALAVRLLETEHRSVSLLDGDVVRHHLSKGLGFARADRDTNVRRIGFVASEITKAGGIAICCPIAPYDETRRDVRAMVEEQGGFFLVHVATPLAECERRDRKGLYAKARRGEIPEFTGISDPYEVPADAEAVVDTTGRTIQACVDDVLAGLTAAGYISTT